MTRKPQTSNLTITLILRILLPIFSFVAFVSEYLYPGVLGNQPVQIAGFVAVLFYTYALNKRNGAYVLSSFYQVYSFLGLMISLIFVYSGIYMIEIGQIGTANSSFWVCSFFYVLGMEAGLLGFLHGRGFSSAALHFPKLSTKLNEALLYMVPLALLLAAVAITIVFSGPILLGVNRVTFWQRMMPWWGGRFPSVFGQSFFIVAMMFFYAKGRKYSLILPYFIVAGYIVATAIVLGEKFSTFMIYLTMWFIVLGGHEYRLRIKIKVILLASIMMGALVSLILISYTNSDMVAGFIYIRIALQGQLIWSVMNESASSTLFGGDWSCYFGCGDYVSGATYISGRYMLDSLFQNYQATGSGLTGYLPALPILAFGMPMAMLLHIVFSYVMGYAQNVLIGSIKGVNLLMSIVSFKFYFGLLIYWYAAKGYVLLGVVVMVVIAILILNLPTNRRAMR